MWLKAEALVNFVARRQRWTPMYRFNDTARTRQCSLKAVLGSATSCSPLSTPPYAHQMSVTQELEGMARQAAVVTAPVHHEALQTSASVRSIPAVYKRCPTHHTKFPEHRSPSTSLNLDLATPR